jgi:hypothetical protein
MAVSAEADIPSQFGRSAVVTGATGGLGYEWRWRWPGPGQKSF